MKRACDARFLFAGLLFILTACQAAGGPSVPMKVGPGETIAGMGLTTGAQDAPPLGAYCSPVRQDGNVITVKCELPVLPKVAVGNLLLLAGDELDGVEWSALRWEVSINDRPLDLEAFGTYRGVRPAMLKTPSPVREAFVEFTAWDIVLTDLAPGEHMLYGVAQTEKDRYTWVLHLIIRSPA